MKDKNLNIELIRVAACFLVVVLHSVIIGMNETGSSGWDILNIIESFTRISVPLFIMISGAVLIKESTNMNSSLKRANRLFIILLFWSAIYYLYRSHVNSFPIDVKSFFNLFFRSQIFYHMWYLYAAIGFVIIMPLLSKFYLHSNKIDVVILVWLWMLLLFFSLLNVYLGLNLNINNLFQVSIFSSLAVYLLLGKIILDNKVNMTNSTKIMLTIMLTACTFATAFITKNISVYRGPVNQMFYDNSSLFIAMSAICFMVFMINTPVKNKTILHIVKFISPCTLGIYLVHPLIIDIFRRFLLDKYSIHPEMFIVISLSFIVFLISLAIVVFLRKFGLSRII
ncbi:acyltransferase family protein [Salmonella enterica]|nr:acyltransferase family protein [Salmonella enterica subsp. enterica serovar Urbana]EHK4055553.1 acyltransferase family protein [Salmonella enterica]